MPGASGPRTAWAAWRGRLHRGDVLPWQLSHLGGPLNTMLAVHLRRLRLRAVLRAADRGTPDDVTVIIGHRNRADYRLVNAVHSIRAQHYPLGRVHTLIVDYGSDPAPRERVRALAGGPGVELVQTEATRWNRSHCLNLGIRRAATKFVMLSDVDVMLAPDFLTTGVMALQADPLAVVYARCLHLPEATGALLEAAAEGRAPLDLAALKSHGRALTDGAYSTGMVLARRACFEIIRGYDEYYHTWGTEDTDLTDRFSWLGLRARSISDRTYYLHQWHPRHEGVPGDALQAAVTRNLEYLRQSRSIARNPRGWGEPTGPAV